MQTRISICCDKQISEPHIKALIVWCGDKLEQYHSELRLKGVLSVKDSSKMSKRYIHSSTVLK